MNQKELIKFIRQLKEIKPRQEWASLTKFEILNPKSETNPNISYFKFHISNFFFGLLTQKRFAYALATLVFFMVGILGFAQYTMPGDLLFPIKKLAEQSQANLSGKTILNQDIAKLNSRINDLAQVAKDGRKDNIPSVISEITANASELTKSLKNEAVKDPTALKEIASGLKVLANVPGTDLSETKDVKDLYEAVVAGQIEDLEKSALTEKQSEKLVEIKKMYEEGKYPDALEEILLINN